MRIKVIGAALAALLAAGLAVCFFVRSKSAAQVEQPIVAESLTTQPQIDQHSPASELSGTDAPAESGTNEVVTTNLYARFANGDILKVSREQLEPFLTKNHRSADALLGALRASGDDDLLREAKEKFPDDPRVQFAAAFKTDSPEESRQWLEKFKASAPDNALPDYLLASDHFKSGESDQALQEIAAAAAKPAFDNYLLDFMQNAEEAYRAGGLPEGDAKAAATMGALLPELARLKQVGVNLAELAKKYRQAGDEASANAVLQMGLDLGHRLDGSPQTTLIQELVGVAIERIALNAMNPGSPYGQTGQTVQNQIDALNERRRAVRALTGETETILASLPDQDLVHYFDRLKVYGEVAALKWVMNKSPQP